jgi:hypothetical protein
MCPACLTSLALIAAKAGSAGGIATAVAWKLRTRRAGKPARIGPSRTQANEEEPR